MEVTAGNAADGGSQAARLVAQAGANGAGVSELVGDMAYGNGDTRAEVAEAGAVVAKVAPCATTGLFTKAEFLIDPAGPNATCPRGVTTHKLIRQGVDHRGRPILALVFPEQPAPDVRCGRAAPRARGRARCGCTPTRLRWRATAGRSGPARFAASCCCRGIERKIAHLMSHGLRKARYRRRRKVLLQARLSAMMVNMKRMFVLGALEPVVQGCATF